MAQRRDTWINIEELPYYTKETQIMTFVWKKESDNAIWSFLDVFSNKWGVEITNK